MDDARFLSELRGYWDKIARGVPATPGDLDPDLAAAIRRLHAMNDVPSPDPTYVNRLRESIMHAAAAPVPLTSGPPFNGRTVPQTPRLWPALLPMPQRRRAWPLAQAAIVLLLIASLVTAYFSLFRQGEEPSNLMPGVATPSPAAVPADGVPMYRGNPARTGEMSGPGPQGQPAELWRVQTGGGISSTPAVAAGTLYVGSDDGHLYALDASTGQERWRFAAEEVGGASPAVTAGIVYVNSGAGVLYALDATSGVERWRYATAGGAMSPLVANGVIFTGGVEDAAMYALDAATGEERWRSPLGAPPNRGAAFADGAVFVGSSDGAFQAIDAASGEQRWRVQTDNVGGAMATPAVSGGIVYEIAFDGPVPNRLYAFDAATGDELWHVQVPEEIHSTVGVAGGTVYAGSGAGVLFAFDAATGTERWRFATDDVIDAAPAVVDGEIYMVGRDRNVYALDAANGAEQWRFAIDGEASWGPVASGGVLYLGDAFGIVYAIAGSDAVADPSTLSAPDGPADATPANGTPVTSQTMDLLWQTTGGPDPLFAAGGTAVAADGTLWVVDGGNNRFQIFSPEGDVLGTWDGTEGGGEAFVFAKSGGGYDGDIAFGPDGTIYVVEAGSQRVQHFAPDRTLLRTWGGFGSADGQFIRPFGLAVDAAGTVYVSDDRRHDVQTFDAEGTFLSAFGGKGSGDGELNEPGGLALDGQGNVVVADWVNNRIVMFANDGTFLRAWGGPGADPGEFRSPSDVVIDAAGTVYVADIDNGRIQAFDADGGLLAVWDAGTTPSGSDNLPYALALDGQGHLYVIGVAADHDSESTVQKFRLPALLTE